MLYIIAFIFGSIWGSFSNVCIYRIPKNMGIIKDRSICPNCQKMIKWYDNIPLLSFIILKAQCRNCSSDISWNYFVVELIAAISFVIIFYFFGISLTTLLFFILSICFIVIFFIDLKHFIIPNEITYPLMVIGFLKSFDPNLNTNLFPNFLNSLIGGLFGFAIIWLIIFIYKKLRNKEGMGLGDAKLLSAMGFWFGWVSIPFIIFFSSAIALLSVIPDLIKNKKNLSSQIPFGPYLIIGNIIFITFVNKIKLFLI